MGKTNYSGVFDGILNDAETIAKDKVRSVGKEISSKMYTAAQRYVDEYYGNYTPRKYKRLHELKTLANPVYEESSSGNMFTVTAGVEYDPGAIAGAHKSNSWYHQSGSNWVDRYSRSDDQNNGIPEADWIFENFWAGTHPVFKNGEQSYVADPQSQERLINDYMDDEIVAKMNSLLALTVSELGLL
ncbi:MAG: hypothetical protein LUB59_03795 [Candidatus Gastranaerophilales bacterium]|nr:hypothetical protein [Candidatus Gastranaerophilales bacterium]